MDGDDAQYIIEPDYSHKSNLHLLSLVDVIKQLKRQHALSWCNDPHTDHSDMYRVIQLSNEKTIKEDENKQRQKSMTEIFTTLVCFLPFLKA